MPLGLHLNLTEGFPVNNKTNPVNNSHLKKRENQIQYNLQENKNILLKINSTFAKIGLKNLLAKLDTQIKELGKKMDILKNVK